MAARSGTDPIVHARFGRDAAVLAVAVVLAAGQPASAHASAAEQVAARSWLAVRSAHLQVVTDAGRETAEKLAVRLEDLRTVLSLAAPALVVDVAPVQVIVFADPALAASYAPRWNGQRDQVSGFFQSAPDHGRLLFAADRSPVPGVAQHEYIHALLDAAMPGVPLWLNEGLASVLESDDLDWANRTVAEVGRMPSLQRLAAPFATLSGGDAQLAYAASAVAVRRLLDQAGGVAIANLLRDLGEGIDFEKAFLHRIQKSLADFEASLL